MGFQQPYSDHYRFLSLSKGQKSTAAEIKAAYYKLSKKLHPDKNKSSDATAQMQALVAAYETLKDTTKKRNYDVVWKAHQPRSEPSRPQTRSYYASQRGSKYAHQNPNIDPFHFSIPSQTPYTYTRSSSPNEPPAGEHCTNSSCQQSKPFCYACNKWHCPSVKCLESRDNCTKCANGRPCTLHPGMNTTCLTCRYGGQCLLHPYPANNREKTDETTNPSHWANDREKQAPRTCFFYARDNCPLHTAPEPEKEEVPKRAPCSCTPVNISIAWQHVCAVCSGCNFTVLGCDGVDCPAPKATCAKCHPNVKCAIHEPSPKKKCSEEEADIRAEREEELDERLKGFMGENMGENCEKGKESRGDGGGGEPRFSQYWSLNGEIRFGNSMSTSRVADFSWADLYS